VRPATRPRDEPARLLVVDPAAPPARALRDARIGELRGLLRPGDLVVLNDAATLPASLAARTAVGEPIELRLAGASGEGRFHAVLFGRGDWRTPTEARPAPPPLAPGERLALDGGAQAEVVAVAPISPRLVELRLSAAGGGGDAAAVWSALYAAGRPVQYSYLERPLPLWAVQTGWARRPWAVEMPSAGRPIDFDLLRTWKRRGVGLATLTHAAGLSSTGDPRIDAALPLPERSDIPAETIQAIEATRARGGRVLAVGTTVVRALEGRVESHGALTPGEGVTDLVLDGRFQPRIVDGLLTGVHVPEESHHRLLQAFAPPALLDVALRHAEAHGYLTHEFGDSLLVLPG
jgi:S-adenosylmethionine:tRNA ribosyltransferase-isomerase